tara:strand:- start:99841 stop:100638 length:798 start_codon:yes stop_codon:yes gene_type:complete
MEVKSLGYRTDLIFSAFDGEIIDRGHYLVVRTPNNPGFYWGNYLLFDQPPSEGDYQRWQSLFAKEIGKPPQTTHQTFGWDSTTDEQGVIAPFLDNGYQIERSVVLVARQLSAPTQSVQGLTVRPLLVDEDWKQSLENQMACREPEFTEANYRVFKERQVGRYRAMTRAGKGAWFGAFLGDRLVADLGVFNDNRLGRYQSVQTHPEFRRQGIARCLLYEAGIHAFDHFGIERLVIVADADSSAERLYKASGFEVEEQQIGIMKFRG